MCIREKKATHDDQLMTCSQCWKSRFIDLMISWSGLEIKLVHNLRCSSSILSAMGGADCCCCRQPNPCGLEEDEECIIEEARFQ